MLVLVVRFKFEWEGKASLYFYKALVLAIALGFLCLLPSPQAHEFLWTLFSNTKDLGGFNFISTIEIEKEYDDDNEKTKHKS